MQCPVCSQTLLMTDRQGVEIDYCPKCRGVWLDRGELEKIIDRSVSAAAPAKPTSDHRDRDDDHRDRDYRDRSDRRDHDDKYPHGKYKKRESWLGELFDF